MLSTKKRGTETSQRESQVTNSDESKVERSGGHPSTPSSDKAKGSRAAATETSIELGEQGSSLSSENHDGSNLSPVGLKTRSVLRRLEESYRSRVPQSEGEINPSQVEVPIGSEDDEPSHIPRATKMPPLPLRMPNTAFGIAMGIAGNSIMWKTASGSEFVTDRIDADTANEVIWYAGVVAGTIIAVAYVYKLVTSFELFILEYNNPLRIHFMNGPHLAMTMLTLGVPNAVGIDINCLRVVWTIGFAAQLIITLFVYEKWMFSTTHNIGVSRPQLLLSTVGWFLLTVLGQLGGIEEAWGLALPSFCFGAGTVFYILVVTNIFSRIHRCSTCKGSPALTLIIAPPSVAVIAVDGFDGNPGNFNVVAEIILGWCLVVFLLLCKLGPMIASQPPVLGAYWAYVFPVSALANACVRYAAVVGTGAAEVMAAIFMGVATFALVVVFLRMSYHCVLCFLGEEDWEDPLVKRYEPDATRSSEDPVEISEAIEDSA